MSSQLSVDLNSDIGESFGSWIMGNDEAIIPYVSSVNIACGFHAGDPSVMMRTIALALKHRVAIGAHPGFADLSGFGRREMLIPPEEVYALMVYQIGALAACIQVQGGTLHHVKPHGALYTMAAKDAVMADAIAQAVYDLNPTLILYGLSGSELIEAGKRKGLSVYEEAFADRTYQLDGTLTSRKQENAVITDRHAAVQQVIHMVKHGKVTTVQGVEIPIRADTICLHGDNPQAVHFAEEIHHALKSQQIRIG